jgi:MYXO-CTERM domain-containing protein
MQKVIAAAAIAAMAGAASADVFISEYLYSGGSGEFVELYVTATTDFTGWSFDDDSQTPGEFDLSAAGVVSAGSFVIFTEAAAGDFIAAWNLGSAVASGNVVVLGGVTNNLGRNDEINIFNGATLVDRLTYGDQNLPGTIRTQNISGNVNPADFGSNDISKWFLSASGDQWGSYLSTGGDLGNPGAIPAPGAVALLGLGGLLAGRRRR